MTPPAGCFDEPIDIFLIFVYDNKEIQIQKERIIMKLTKRILCLLLAAALTFALCACGNDAGEDNKDNTPQTTTTTNALDGNLDGDSIYNDGMFSEW